MPCQPNDVQKRPDSTASGKSRSQIADMDEVGMEEGIGEEGPDLGAETAGEAPASELRGVVARRNEGEIQQEIEVLVIRQHPLAAGLDEDKHHDDLQGVSGTVRPSALAVLRLTRTARCPPGTRSAVMHFYSVWCFRNRLLDRVNVI